MNCVTWILNFSKSNFLSLLLAAWGLNQSTSTTVQYRAMCCRIQVEGVKCKHGGKGERINDWTAFTWPRASAALHDVGYQAVCLPNDAFSLSVLLAAVLRIIGWFLKYHIEFITQRILLFSSVFIDHQKHNYYLFVNYFSCTDFREFFFFVVVFFMMSVSPSLVLSYIS